MAGVEEEDAGRDELVLAQLPLLALRDEELADEVVPEVGATGPGVAADELREVMRRRGGALLDFARDAELVHRHHRVRPGEELRAHRARHAEQVRDHGDGNGRREGLDQVRLAVGGEGVDPLVGERGDAGCELLHLARDEGAVDEVSEAGVLGRLHLENRMALERVEGGEMRLRRRPAERLAGRDVKDLPAEAPVAQQRRHVGVRREAPETVVLPEEGGRCRPDGGVGRIRVVEEGRVARIEADPAAPGVDYGDHRPATADFCRRPRVIKGLRGTGPGSPVKDLTISMACGRDRDRRPLPGVTRAAEASSSTGHVNG